jgi:hypothetical protein
MANNNKKNKEEANIVTDARLCFLGSGAGKRTLANMLTEARFFAVAHTPEEQAVENFVKVILGWTGSYPIEGVSSKERIDMFVEKLTEMRTEY